MAIYRVRPEVLEEEYGWSSVTNQAARENGVLYKDCEQGVPTKTHGKLTNKDLPNLKWYQSVATQEYWAFIPEELEEITSDCVSG